MEVPKSCKNCLYWYHPHPDVGGYDPNQEHKICRKMKIIDGASVHDPIKFLIYIDADDGFPHPKVTPKTHPDFYCSSWVDRNEIEFGDLRA